MSDRSFGFLQGYPVELYRLDTKNGPNIDREDDGTPAMSQRNINLYRQFAADNITTAMQDLTQKKFEDAQAGNIWIQASMFSPVKLWHEQIFDQVSIGIAKTLIENSRNQRSLNEALQNIYDAVVLNGLDLHFDTPLLSATFNLAESPPTSNASLIPPPGFKYLAKTTTGLPSVPKTIPFKQKYDGFSAAITVQYDQPPGPDVPDSNYGNKYPERKITEGSGSTRSAPESIIGQCFDTYIEAVDGKVPLTHEGISTSGNPITLSDVIIVTV